MTNLVVEHPRNVAEKQLRRLESLGFSLLSAYELEFHLSDAKGRELVTDRIGFAGSTVHFNHSLWDKTGNVMSNKSGDLTDTAKHWIAGLLAHARALTPLMAPTVNGINMFGAYQPPNWVEPSFITWGRHNRSVTFRVKSSGGPTGSYIENRLGRSDADPYLLLAGTIAAGLDGIVNKLTLPSECTGDAHTDIPPGTPRLPFDMEEGVTALVDDKVLCEALGKDFIDLIVAARRHEIELYNTNKTDI